MTLAEIRLRVRELTGEAHNDAFDNDGALNDFINEGLFELVRGRAILSCMLDVVRGAAEIGGLPGFREALLLSDDSGAAQAFSVRLGKLRGPRDGVYVLCYRADPPRLTADDDAPELPEPLHGALADYGAWRLLATAGREGQARGAMFRARFESACALADRFFEERLGAAMLEHKY